VTDVCAACGYNNINHFIRIFKVFEGITPTKYRQNPKPSEVA
jgi:YesN/AraC family two-component response regulator